VELENGESWFVHFQDMDAYGRIVHLNPVTWNKDGWPLIGIDSDGDGIGEPVTTYTKPATVVSVEPHGPQTSDEFNGTRPGLQWQWHANPRQEWMFHSGNLGFMRLYCTVLSISLLILVACGEDPLKPITLHPVVDSTMADKPDPENNPERGWGQVFPAIFNELVTVRNHAVNGRSTKE
jgi:hypothetical protein